MEHKAKKMLALGAVIMLCAVAMIGAGYAAFTGAARTYNTGNNVSSESLVLDVANFDAIIAAGDVEFDTYDTPTAGTDAYYFNATKHPSVVEVNDGTSTVTSIELGSKVLTLTNYTQEAITSITLGIKSDKDVGTSNFKFFVKADILVGETHTTGYADVSTTEQTIVLAPANWESSGDSQTTLDNGESIAITLTLYYGYVADCSVPNSHIGPTGDVGAENSTNAKLSTLALKPVTATSFGLGFSVIQTPA